MDVQANATFNKLIGENPNDRYAAQAKRMLNRISRGR
jgi:outer membrane protein assembly factor BamD (BamD/ComL family)